MAAWPWATAVTKPFWSTVATLSLSELQVTLLALAFQGCQLTFTWRV